MATASQLGAMAGRLSVDEEIVKKPVPEPSTKGRLLTTAEIISCYGHAGDPDLMTIITTPYPFRIAWDTTHSTNRVTCHKKIAIPLLAVFNDLLSHYGEQKLVALGIDLFGGLYNYRPQRGLEKKYEAAIKAGNPKLAYTYLSRHSWAISIDLDPSRNQLKQKANTAQFAKPEYNAMQDIFYSHQFIGYGRERGNDFMHFEIGAIL